MKKLYTVTLVEGDMMKTGIRSIGFEDGMSKELEILGMLENLVLTQKDKIKTKFHKNIKMK